MILSGVALAGSPLPAQEQRELEKKDEPIRLTPFEVRAEQDAGYAASQSLLGGRMSQEIKDIPSQIEVMTSEFLADFAVTTLQDAFRYSLNIENAQEYMATRDGGDDAAWNGTTVARIRGIRPSRFSTSRNLFSSITPADSYNIDRVEIASGAQSLLFSLGEPAGIANVQLKNADLTRTFGRVTGQVDSEQGYRAVLDGNWRILPKKLGLRLSMMSQDDPKFIKPSYDREDRYYGTVTYQPFTKTKFRLHAERVRGVSNRPVEHLPFDWATPFYAAIPSGTQNSIPAAVWGVSAAGVLLFGGNDAPLDYVHWRTNLIPTSPGSLPFDTARFGSAMDPNTGFPRITFNPDNIKGIPNGEDFLGRNFLGDAVKNRLNSNIYDVFLEQQLTDTLVLELGAHQEDYKFVNNALMQYGWYGLKADMNRYFPTALFGIATQPTATTPNFVPNPNYGKLYVSAVPNGRIALEETTEARASLAWNPKFHERLPWIGVHSFLANWSTRESWQKTQVMSVRLLNDPVKYATTPAGYATAQRTLVFTHYFDEQNKTVSLPFGNALSFDDYFEGFTHTLPSGEVLEFGGWDAPGAGSRPEGSKARVDSLMGAWQGKFLDNRVLLNYGYRNDEVIAYALDNTTTGPAMHPKGTWYIVSPDNDGFLQTSKVNQRGESHTYGGVVRPLKTVSLSYYQSDTFNLPNGSLTPWGETILGANGSSKDYSIRFDTKDGKAYFKLNKYEVVQRDNTIQQGVLKIAAMQMELSYRNIVNTVADADPSAPDYYELIAQQGLPANGVNADDGLGATLYPVIGDIVSKGYEITAGLKWRQWDFRFNFAKNETLNTNVSRDWLNWIDERITVWQGLRDINGNGFATAPYVGADAPNYQTVLPGGGTRVMTMQEFYNSVLIPAVAVVEQQNGVPTDVSRKYRANLNAAYSFNEGRLRGIRVGGALRWRSSPIIGFPLIDLPNPNGALPLPGFDLSNPYKGDDLIDVDLFAAYRGKRLLGTKLNYQVQFNVRDLLTNDGTYRIDKVNGRGEGTFVSYQTPRSFSLTMDIFF